MTDSPRSLFEMSPVHEQCFREPERVAEADETFMEDMATADADADAAATSLHYVAASPAPRAPDAVRFILEHQLVEPTAVDIRGATPIFWAARWGAARNLKAFDETAVRAAADVRDRHGNSVFHWWAMGHGEPEAACDELLTETGHDPAGQNAAGLLPGHAALHAPSRLKRMLRVWAELRDVTGKDGYPLIFHAAALDRTDAAQVLIDHGVDPWTRAGQFQPIDLVAKRESWIDLVGAEPSDDEDPHPDAPHNDRPAADTSAPTSGPA